MCLPPGRCDFYSAEKARGYKSRWNAESPGAAVSSSERDVLRPSRAHQEVLGGHLLPHRYQGLRKVSPPPRTAPSRPPAPVPSCCAAPATAPTTCNVERVSGERGAGRRGPPRGSAAWTPPAPIAKSHVPTGPPTPAPCDPQPPPEPKSPRPGRDPSRFAHRSWPAA